MTRQLALAKQIQEQPEKLPFGVFNTTDILLCIAKAPVYIVDAIHIYMQGSLYGAVIGFGNSLKSTKMEDIIEARNKVTIDALMKQFPELRFVDMSGAKDLANKTPAATNKEWLTWAISAAEKAGLKATYEPISLCESVMRWKSLGGEYEFFTLDDEGKRIPFPPKSRKRSASRPALILV